MKYLTRTFVALSVAIWTVTAAFAAGPTYRLEVAGLACPFCAYGIEKELSVIDGVERLETNIGEGTVLVTMKDGATLDESMAEQAVKDAGFTFNGLEQVTPGNSQ